MSLARPDFFGVEFGANGLWPNLCSPCSLAVDIFADRVEVMFKPVGKVRLWMRSHEHITGEQLVRRGPLSNSDRRRDALSYIIWRELPCGENRSRYEDDTSNFAVCSLLQC